MTAHKIGFLIWPSTKALTLALAEEALRVAQRVHPDVVYELSFLQAEPRTEGAWQLPGEPWAGKLEGFQKLFLLADEPPTVIASQLSTALKQLVRAGCVIGGLSAGVYPLAQLGLLDGYRAAVHWRWQDDFAERFPKVIATSHLFDWDRDRLTACGGMSVLDLLLAVLARDHGAELAGAVSEELVVERIRDRRRDSYSRDSTKQLSEAERREAVVNNKKQLTTKRTARQRREAVGNKTTVLHLHQSVSVPTDVY